MNLSKLTQGEQFIVKWQYKIGGGFCVALGECMMYADDMNLQKLATVYPEEVRAIRSFKGNPGWWDRVKKSAGVEIP